MNQVRFRRDLDITPKQQGNQRVYVIRRSETGDVFEFGEEDYFLCQALDGETSPAEIATRFQTFFGKGIEESDVVAFSEELARLGLGEQVNGTKARRPEPEAPPEAKTDPPMRQEDAEAEWDEEDGSPNETRYKLVDPSRFFDGLNRLFGWVETIAWPLAVVLAGSGFYALYLLFSRQHEIAADQAASGINALPYLGRLVMTLLLLNLVRCLVQGTALTHLGGRIREGGVRLRFGLIPRFYINRSDMRQLDRPRKMWCYASTILTRLGMMAVGALIWRTFRLTNPSLASLGILFLQGGFIGFLLVTIPLRNSDGFRFMAQLFGWPDNLVRQAIQMAALFLKREKLPVSRGRAFLLILYAAILVAAWTFFLFWVGTHIAEGLNQTFPDIFGRATESIILALVLIVMARWFLDKLPGARQKNRVAAEEPPSRRGWWVALVILGVLLLPFPYRPGGPCTLLPPVVQPLQVLETGIVAEVAHRGGDGAVLERGTVVATLRSPEIEAEEVQTRELLRNQEATLAKERANLKRLRAGPRQEEIDAAKARLERTTAEVEAANASLNAASVGFEYATNEVKAYEPLAEQGAYATLLLEEKRKMAKLSQIEIGKARQALEAARKSENEARAELALLQAGASADEIEAAEQTVAAVAAEVARLEAVLDFIAGQRERLTLRMPIDGVLVESHLERQLGSRLEPGEVFATVQEPGLPLVEVELPEAEAGEVGLESRAEIRLVARPSAPLRGVVEAIEPAASDAELTRVVTVLVKIEADPSALPLKAGMSGYCKLDAGYRPLGFLLLRPLIRFFQVEVWSWLP